MRRALLALCLLVGGLAAVGPDPGRAAVVIHRVDGARFQPTPDKPVFLLVIGHDARPGETQSRGDALHVIGVNPAAGRATILNIPRDTWTEIPGRGLDKINAGYLYGGPALQAKAVSALVGVDISLVLTTGFEGLAAMVDDLGGVDVVVPQAMDDPKSGAFFPAGRVRMDGGAALAFSRNRSLPGGDFTRTQDQGILILAGLAKLRGEDPSPARTLRWLSVLARHARLDGATLGDLYRLGRLGLSIDPANVANVTMPGTTGSAANQSVVFASGSASSLFADFRDDALLQRGY